MLGICGSGCYAPYAAQTDSRDAVAKARDSAELYVVEGATHVDLYDRDEAVTPAVAKLTAFFGTHL